MQIDREQISNTKRYVYATLVLDGLSCNGWCIAARIARYCSTVNDRSTCSIPQKKRRKENKKGM